MKNKLAVIIVFLLGVANFSNAADNLEGGISAIEITHVEIKTDYRDGYAWVLYNDGCFRLSYVIYENEILVYDEPVNPVYWASGGPTTICTYSDVINEMC